MKILYKILFLIIITVTLKLIMYVVDIYIKKSQEKINSLKLEFKDMLFSGFFSEVESNIYSLTDSSLNKFVTSLLSDLGFSNIEKSELNSYILKCTQEDNVFYIKHIEENLNLDPSFSLFYAKKLIGNATRFNINDLILYTPYNLDQDFLNTIRQHLNVKIIDKETITNLCFKNKNIGREKL